MKTKTICLTLIVTLGLLSCKIQVKPEGDSKSIEDLSIGYEPIDIGFYDVYRLSDENMLQFLRNIKKVDNFIPIFNLDIGNYPQNVLGIIENENNKMQVLDELLLTDSLSLNSKLVWSKRKQLNMRTNEEGFHLYMLKKDSRKISNQDIKSAKAKKNQYGKDFIVEITFNESGTQKWSTMTKKAYEDDKNYIAIVVNEEVYSCPYVMGQLDSPYFSLNEFENLEESTKVAKGIMKKVDNK